MQWGLSLSVISAIALIGPAREGRQSRARRMSPSQGIQSQDDIRTTSKAVSRKLSDYYHRILSYDGLRANFEGDNDLLDHLKSAKYRLAYHFRLHYADEALHYRTIPVS